MKYSAQQRPLGPHRVAHLATLSIDNVESIVTNLTCSLDVSVSDEVFENLAQFLYDEYNIINNINSIKQLTEHYNSCKTRYEALYKKIEELLDLFDLDDLESVRLTRRENRKLFHMGQDTTIVVTDLIDSYIVRLIDTVHPRSYRYLYKAMAQFLYEISGTSWNQNLRDKFQQFSLVILSLGKIYDDIRGNDDFIMEQEREAFTRLQTPDIELSEELKAILDSVLDDIYDESQRFPYVADLQRQLRIGKYLESPFNEDVDYHVSLRSTGTKVNGIAQKGLIASIVETDPLIETMKEFDEAVGYHSYYLRDNIRNGYSVKQYNRKTISIEQHKLKRRIIYMCANAIQDRAQWYHNRLARFIDSLPSDCTFRQWNGIQRALIATSPEQVRSHQWNIYSLDLSNATDTLSRQYQQICIDMVMPNLGKFWSQLVFHDHTFVFHDKTEKVLSPKRGQPQGYKSSFPAFALAHHMLMRMVMKLHGLENMRPEDFYRVLGDDSLITVKDPDKSIMYDYIRLCGLVGWECHEDKGYKFFYDSDEHASAEFAKVRVMDGKVFTPVPLMLMLNSNKPSAKLSTCLFNIKRGLVDSSLSSLVKRLQNMGEVLSETYIHTMDLLAFFGYGDFKHVQTSLDHVDNEEAISFLQAFYKIKLRGTILEQWLPSQLIGDASYSIKDKDPFIGLENEEKFLSIFDIPDNHKYWYLVYKNEELIHCLDSIFGEQISNKGILGLELSESDRSIIYSACELLMDDISSIKDGTDVFIKTLTSAINILDHYNPRSESRCSQRDSDYINDICNYFEQISFDRFIA